MLGAMLTVVVIPGGVGAILATLLQHYGKPEGVGDVTCYAVGPAAVFTAELAETVTPFVTSVVLGCVSSCNPESRLSLCRVCRLRVHVPMYTQSLR
jgi:hypothetical protein